MTLLARQILLLAFLTVGLTNLSSADTSLIESTKSPEIFGEEVTVFDLYLSDIFVGSILTKYTDDWFEVDDPKDLVDQLKGATSRSEVLPLVSGKIPLSREIPGIGSIQIDYRTFRIIINLDPRLLPTKKINTTGRLPDPNSEFSLLQTFRTAANGQLDESFTGALNHRTVAAYGKYFARFDGTVVGDKPYVLTEGLLGGIAGDFEFGTGFLQTAGQTFASSVDVLGVRIKTSEQIFADQELIRGSKFSVFIPSRSRVEFFRDGQLIGVQILDYGLQDINTRQFPDGSYDIDIVINEDNGGVQRETRFFTKSGFLSAIDKPIWDFSAGIGRDQLNLFDIPVYQAGVKWRVADLLQLGGSIYGTEDITVLDLNALSYYADNYLTLGVAANNSGNQGVYGSIGGPIAEGFVYSLNASATLNPDETISDPVVELTDRNKELIRTRLNDITRERRSFSGSLMKQFGDVSIGVVGTQNKRVQNPFFNSLLPRPDRKSPIDNRFAYGPKFEWRILQDQAKSLRFEAFYLHADDGDNVTARLAFQYRFDSDLSVQSELRNDSRSGDNDTTLLNTVSYDARTRQQNGFRGILTNELKNQERVSKQKTVTNNGQVNYQTDYLKVDGFVRDIRGEIDPTTNIGIEGSAAFIVSNSGEVSVSRPIQEGAALIVDLESNTTTDKFNVLLNNQVIETVSAGQRTVLGINPYNTYTVMIRPAASDSMLSYDNSSEEFTVFPGNIIKRTWKISSVVVVVGKLVDVNGDPIPLKRIRGTKDYVTTDEFGSFQADLTGDETLFIESEDLECKIKTPDLKNFDGYLMDVGDLVCK